MGKTLFDKVWDKHVVTQVGTMSVLYIDKQLIHEVTSPQAFSGLEKRGIGVWNTKQIVATPDHNVPTLHQNEPIEEPLSRQQVATLQDNCKKFGIELYDLLHPYQGIVHVIGPELGITQPGMTMVCGDSHTATHGAFGTIAFGIGTSQVEQVMATQCLLQTKPKRMRINISGKLNSGVLSKDIILYIISKLGTGGGTGYFVEYAGDTIRSLSMEARMTICNMSIEMGAKGGLIAPDDITFSYMKGKQFAPKDTEWDKAVNYWKTLYSDTDAIFDHEVNYDAQDITPMITYGTNPGMGIKLSETVPVSDSTEGAESFRKSLNYMGFKEGQSLIGLSVNYVFVGSCTNSRIEDLRIFADYVKGKQKASNIVAWIVPGSKQVEKQAKEEGIDKVLKAAGFELREPGCSACLAMNEDKIPNGEYCVSTSNRNFEGRQGPGAKTLLASPLTAAKVAIAGKIVV